MPSKKVFAYGGCFGPTTIEEVDKWHCRAFVASGLGSMCGLGMRDQNSICIANELTGKQAELVCDPVILYGYKKEERVKRGLCESLIW
ncbi:polysaccharide pyruvyl transferase family protein [Bacteroides sp. BFG-637]|uniref:polysaccharide pyruvyl transferase family protein n=1 Tax=Bacteroides sp. BFG-637 TaxID=2972764 RepID=UPI0038D4A1E3